MADSSCDQCCSTFNSSSSGGHFCSFSSLVHGKIILHNIIKNMYYLTTIFSIYFTLLNFTPVIASNNCELHVNIKYYDAYDLYFNRGGGAGPFQPVMRLHDDPPYSRVLEGIAGDFIEAIEDGASRAVRELICPHSDSTIPLTFNLHFLILEMGATFDEEGFQAVGRLLASLDGENIGTSYEAGGGEVTITVVWNPRVMLRRHLAEQGWVLRELFPVLPFKQRDMNLAFFRYGFEPVVGGWSSISALGTAPKIMTVN